MSKTKQKGTKNKMGGYHFNEVNRTGALGEKVRRGAYEGLEKASICDPNASTQTPAQIRMNRINSFKSTDSKDLRDQIRKAQGSKSKDKMKETIEHMVLSKKILDNCLRQLRQKDKMKAIRYFQDIF